MAGEVVAYVQGGSLKATALFFVRVSNSPVTSRRTK
jgi:hypothetical protein